MTTPAAPSNRTWQTQYSADESHWDDLKRIGKIFLPIAVLAFLAVMAAAACVAFRADYWGSQIKDGASKFWVVVQILLVVIIPLLAVCASIILTYKAAIAFVRSFYKRPGDEKILPLIQRRMLGIPPLPPPLDMAWKYPFVTIKEPRDLKPDHWVRWLGGPASLVIYDGTALYLERGSRFARVVGPGKPPMPFLDHWETVRAVVDLRPQVKTGKMKPWTKDGIQVELDIRMECQVNASEEARVASRNLVYPFDPMAVKQAAEYTSVKYDAAENRLYESDWLDGVWGQVTGYLAAHVSRHSVDELALSELENVGPSEGNLQTIELAREHIEAINKDLDQRNCGAHVLNIHVMPKYPDPVDQQRTQYWEAQRKKQAAIRQSRAEANGIRDREEARANAERDVLNAITERLKRVGTENLTEPVLLSLTGILDNTLEEPMVRSLVAKQSLDLLEKIRKALKEKF